MSTETAALLYQTWGPYTCPPSNNNAGISSQTIPAPSGYTWLSVGVGTVGNQNQFVIVQSLVQKDGAQAYVQVNNQSDSNTVYSVYGVFAPETGVTGAIGISTTTGLIAPPHTQQGGIKLATFTSGPGQAILSVGCDTVGEQNQFWIAQCYVSVNGTKANLQVVNTSESDTEFNLVVCLTETD